MAELVELDKSLLKPVYTQAQPNEAISWGDVRIRFAHRVKTFEEMAHAAMWFAPTPCLFFVLLSTATYRLLAPEEVDGSLASVFKPDAKWDGKLERPERGPESVARGA